MILNQVLFVIIMYRIYAIASWAL